jgi:HK97 family phage prohead protease
LDCDELIRLQETHGADHGRIFWQEEHFEQLARHYKISKTDVHRAVSAAPMLSSTAAGVITKAAPKDAQRSFKYVMNDGETDRMGDIVVADGVDLVNFKRNPVALFAHDQSQPPIGSWSGVHAAGGKLKGTLTLAPTAAGEHMRELIASKVLKAVSIGFIPGEFEPISTRSKGFRFTKGTQLLECSVVPVPASPGALVELGFEERLAELKETRDKILREQAQIDVAEAKRQADFKRTMARVERKQETREQRKRRLYRELDLIKLMAPQ